MASVLDTINSSSNPKTPAIGDIDLASILNNINAVNTSINSNVNATVEAKSAGQKYYQDSVDLYETVATDQMAITSANESAAAAAKNKAIEISAAIGYNPEIMANLGAQLSSQYNETQSRLADIKQKESVGFFDDPLSYIENLFSLPSDYQQLNTTIDQYNSTEDRMKTLNTLSDANVQSQLLLTAAKSNDTIQKESFVAAATFKDKGIQARIDSLKYGIDLTGIINRDKNAIINNQLSAHSAVIQEDAAQQRKEEFARQRQNDSLERQIKEQQLKSNQYALEDRQASDAEDEKTALAYKAGLTLMGQADLAKGLTTKAIVKMINTNGAMGQKAQAILDSGMVSLSRTTTGIASDRVIGGDAASAAFIIDANNAPGNGEDRVMFDLVHKTLATARASNAGMKQDQIINKAVQDVQTAINTAGLNIEYGKGNIRELLPASVILQATPSLQASNFSKSVLAPILATKGSEDPSNLLNSGIANVIAGNMSAQDLATGIADYFSKGNQVTQQARGIKMLGYSGGDDFKTTIQTPTKEPGIWSGYLTAHLDMTNSTKVLSYINKQLLHQKLHEAGFGEGVSL